MPPPSTVQVPFTGGIDQATAPEFVDPASKVVSVTNGIWHHEGGIEKRLGVTFQPNAQLPGDPTMRAPLRLVSRGSEVARIDGDSLFSYSPAVQRWAQRSVASPCVATRSHLLSAVFPIYLTSDEGSGCIATAFEQNSASGTPSIYVTLQDATTGAPIFSNLYLGDSIHNYTLPICIINGGFLVVLAVKIGKLLVAWSLNLSTMVWSAETTLVTAPTLLPCYDATPRIGSTNIEVTWVSQTNGTGPTGTCIWKFATLPVSSLVLGTATTVFDSTGSGGFLVDLVACRYDANLGCHWLIAQLPTVNESGTTYAIKMTKYDAGVTQLLALTSCSGSWFTNTVGVSSLSIEILSATQMLYIAGPVLDADLRNTPASPCVVASFDDTPISHNFIVLPWSSPASRPFLAKCNGVTRCYAMALYMQFSSDTQGAMSPNQDFATGSYYLVDFGVAANLTVGAELPRVVASVAPRQAVVAPVLFQRRPNYASGVGLSTAGHFRLAILLAGSEEFSPSEALPLGTAQMGVDLAYLDFTGATAWASAEVNQETAIACGTPHYYDGQTVSEFAFFAWPYATAVNSGVGSLSAGTYGYALCFSQVDAAGQIHRSALYQLSVVAGASSLNTLTIDNLAFTDRYTANRPVLCEVYRTQANGSIYYYVGNVLTNPQSNAGHLSLVDSAADATIATNTTLYTTGGVLDSVTPPSARHIIRHNERLWMIDDTGYVVWLTTPVNGADAPYCNEGLTITFEDGPLTALAELDANLVVFSARRIWVIAGDGPAITGVGSDLTNPASIPTDVGPGDWRSVVESPVGVFFQAASNGGIYLLGRDLQVTYIGKEVQDTVGPYAAGNPVVVQATLHPEQGQVRFLLAGASTKLVYFDYVLRRWGTFTYPALAGSAPCALTVPSTGAWYLGGADGFLYQENTPATAAAWLDKTSGASTFVQTSITSGRIRGAGLQSWLAWGPVQGYATWLDPCDITVSLLFDNAAAGGQSNTFAHAALVAANATAAQWQLTPRAANSNGQALQVVLSDATASDATSVTGRGVRWLGFAADVTLLGGRNINLPASVKA